MMSIDESVSFESIDGGLVPIKAWTRGVRIGVRRATCGRKMDVMIPLSILKDEAIQSCPSPPRQ